MHCTECITDFYFVYGTNNCYEMSFKDENDYFFSERDIYLREFKINNNKFNLRLKFLIKQISLIRNF